VWYRAAHERSWRSGITHSISTSGAIIQPDDRLIPTGPIVVAIPLPVVPGCLVGRGRIVRSSSKPATSEPATFAIAVDRYRIGRSDDVLSSPAR
jgi:hypothetical protein